MPVALSVRVEGVEELVAKLEQISPRRNDAWVRRSLIRAGLLTQEIAATQKIRRGGHGPPVPKILTSRTGTLRRSIRVNQRNLPRSIEVGSDLVYAPVHELGGRYHPRRPFLAPALEDASRKFEDIFSSEWAQEIDR